MHKWSLDLNNSAIEVILFFSKGTNNFFEFFNLINLLKDITKNLDFLFSFITDDFGKKETGKLFFSKNFQETKGFTY